MFNMCSTCARFELCVPLVIGCQSINQSDIINVAKIT